MFTSGLAATEKTPSLNQCRGMAAVPVSSRFWGLGIQHGKEEKGQKDPGYLSSMFDYVLGHKNERIPLKNPADATLTIGNVDETIYRGKMDVLNGWNKFYLPDIVSMQVLGVVTGTSCPGDHLVLMTCEDEQLYAYDGEELHLVAVSVKQLRNKGIEYPADKSYYKGEAFPNTDWEEVRKSAVGRRLDQEHRELVTAKTPEFMQNLRSIQTGHEETRAVIKNQQQDGSLKRTLDCNNDKAAMDGWARWDTGRTATSAGKNTSGSLPKHPRVVVV
uniref:uncharacterized protein LOC120826469 isoform X21 n=2 Tax=Gasterosteus aculeatus aculeatus TaxID=481459 RepID=UPI001A983F9C|nr:uncharacterized protein LOC120826469 isoform X21 [Gasterosteus aculeatus aculeatus]